MPPALAELRQAVATQLTAPDALVAELAAAAAAAGLKGAEGWSTGGGEWGRAWSAICQVLCGNLPSSLLVHSFL